METDWNARAMYCILYQKHNHEVHGLLRTERERKKAHIVILQYVLTKQYQFESTFFSHCFLLLL